MGACYAVINNETRELFELGKFGPAWSADWNLLQSDPEKLVGYLHNSYREAGNLSFDLPWCLSLIMYMRKCLERPGHLTVISDSGEDFDEYESVGSRHDSFEGQAV